MADNLPSTNHYNLLAGVNTKASDYLQNQAGFRDLRNLDFFVPNALSKRPGSTQMVSAGTSGPISSLFEFQKLDGASYIIAGSDTAMFYMASNAFTLLSSGWNNGQPTDMLTFQNKLWMANGQKWESWGATGGISASPVGLPMQQALIVPQEKDFNGASYFLVGGATHWPNQSGGSFTMRGVYVAYSYLRDDGYVGPAEFIQSARNIVVARPNTSGDEAFSNALLNRALGFTVPSGYGISAIQIWVGVDTVHGVDGGATLYLGATWGTQFVGQLGWNDQSGGTSARRMSYTLHPSANLNRFHLWTSMPGSSFFLSSGLTGYPNISPGNVYGTTFLLSSSAKTFADLDSVASGDGFSGVNFNFFGSYIPKYIEQNNNVMFSAGFSSAPSTVWFSDIGAPETYQSDYNFEVRTNDGDKITGQKTYNNQVIVTKERSFHKIIGSTPDDLQLVELSTEFGNLSNKSMVEVDQKLLWLDKRGILEFNGSSWQIISTPVEPMFRRMNLAAASKAVAVNHQYRNQVWFGIPIDGSTTNNLTVVFDYLVGGWTFFDGFSPASLALIKGPLSTPTAWHGDYSGLVHSFGESLFGDNGRGITCLGLPNWEIDQGQQSTSIWRRFFLDVASNSSGLTGSISTRVFSNYDASTVQATFLMHQSAYQSRADFGVVGKSVTAEFAHYSASLPIVIKGFSWTKRFLRNV